MFGSASFPQGSTDEGLLNRFNETYNKTDLSRPTLFVIHNCQIHWPLQQPFPYYPREDLPDDRFSPIAYGSKLSLEPSIKNAKGVRTGASSMRGSINLPCANPRGIF